MLLGFGDKYVFHYMSVVVFNVQIIIISCFSHKNNNRGTKITPGNQVRLSLLWWAYPSWWWWETKRSVNHVWKSDKPLKQSQVECLAWPFVAVRRRDVNELTSRPGQGLTFSASAYLHTIGRTIPNIFLVQWYSEACFIINLVSTQKYYEDKVCINRSV